GGAGNDELDGGDGVNTLIGGQGNDFYHFGAGTGVITELAGQGTDTIEASVTFSLAGFVNVENLEFNDNADIDGTGNDLNNVINGADGKNILSGGKGNDQLFGFGD